MIYLPREHSDAPETEEQLGIDIDEAVNMDNFYSLGINRIINILNKCKIRKSDTINKLINMSLQRYGDEAQLLLKHIEFDEIDVSVFENLSYIPLFREASKVITQLQSENMKLKQSLEMEMKSKSQIIEQIRSDDEGFDVDWELKYSQERKKNEDLSMIIKHLNSKEVWKNNPPEKIALKKSEKDIVASAVKNKDYNTTVSLLVANPSLVLGRVDFCSNTLLHLAAGSGWMDGVKLIMDVGAGVDGFCDIRNDYKWTPFYRACAMNELEIAEFLLSKGADINALDNKSWSPLTAASMNGHLRIVQFLLSNGADIEVDPGNTPLLWACTFGNLDVVKYLVSKGADLSVRNREGETIVMAAARCNKVEVAEYLRDLMDLDD